MDIVRLPDGILAPAEADCLRLVASGDGRVELIGNALLACGDSEDGESISIVGGPLYGTYEEAECAGIAWANEHCVEQLYVTRLPPDAPED